MLAAAESRGDAHRASLLYCQGNGWLALKEYDSARDAFVDSLLLLVEPELVPLQAKVTKNLGSTLEVMGETDAARLLYERAVELEPELEEAHFALALWHHRFGKDDQKALHHLDQAIPRQPGTAHRLPSIQAWRIPLLFGTGDFHGAFRDIQSLLFSAEQYDWVWPWFAGRVATYGRSNTASAQKALVFWTRYLDKLPGDLCALRELVMCQSLLHAEGVPLKTTYAQFKASVIELVTAGDSESPLLWDRLGHWAQDEGDWQEAEKAYRKAYEMMPEMFGYCFGTALNALGKFDEAIPVLQAQAEQHEPDAMSWAHLGFAKAGQGDKAGAIAAYKQAISLDLNYENAWFDLGGVYWNSGDTLSGVLIWDEALRRFPNHAAADKIRNMLPGVFNPDAGIDDLPR